MATAKTPTTATTKPETCFTPLDKAPLVGAPVAEADAVAVRTPVDENGCAQIISPVPSTKTRGTHRIRSRNRARRGRRGSYSSSGGVRHGSLGDRKRLGGSVDLGGVGRVGKVKDVPLRIDQLREEDGELL